MYIENVLKGQKLQETKLHDQAKQEGQNKKGNKVPHFLQVLGDVDIIGKAMRAQGPFGLNLLLLKLKTENNIAK